MVFGLMLLHQEYFNISKLSTVGQERTSAHISTFMKTLKKTYQSQEMSTAGQVLPGLAPPTEESDKCQAFNRRLLAFSEQGGKQRGADFTSTHEEGKGRNGENRCHLQHITFTE